jgi:hypothetical protein
MPTFLISVLWLCFVARVFFYASFVPLWEGYDEFSHFGFVQHLAANHSLPDPRNATVSKEIAESLRLAPVPWTIREWKPGWTTHDDYWRLPREVRRERERTIRELSPQLALESAPDLSQYEAQQPPLAYLVFSLPYAAFRSAPLVVRAWLIRIVGGLIASLIVPAGFLISRRFVNDDWQAVGVAAVIASTPELMLSIDHGGNEPLAILFGAGCLYGLRRVADDARKLGSSFLLGAILGLGLLTKAYFLAVIPAVCAVYAVSLCARPQFRRRIFLELLTTFGVAAVIAGWWYAHAILVTGTPTGDQTAIAARQSGVSVIRAVMSIDWRRVADFAIFSHIWLGGWSFLVLRTWMYRLVEFLFLGAGIGIVFRSRRTLRTVSSPARLAICLALQFFFWAGMAWHALTAFRASGQAGVFGFYAYALVIPETVCLIAGIGALLPRPTVRFIVPALVSLFAALEIFAVIFYLMPYYAGFTAHTNKGNVPAMSLSSFGNFGQLFRNLAVNKPGFLTPEVLVGLWIGFLVAAAASITVSFVVARECARPAS